MAYKNPDNDPRGPWKAGDYTSNKNATERPNLYYPITNPNTGKEAWPSKDRVWAYSPEQHLQNQKEGRVWWGTGGQARVPAYKRYLSEVMGLVPRTIWSYDEVGHNQDAVRELQALFGQSPFPSAKPIGLVKRIAELCDSSVTFDYFAGSGTTGHAVINLNREDGGRRKFILVEMGDYFNTVLVPRIAKVMYTPEWKDGKPKRMATAEEVDRTPRLVKILKLESYEDALHNLTTEQQLEKVEGGSEAGGDRRIVYVLDRLLEKSGSMLNWEALDRPFDYTIEILTDEGDRESPIDLVETFNALYGLRVQRFELWTDPDTKRQYRVVKARKGDKRRVLVIWRNVPPEKEAGADRAFLEKRIGSLAEWDEAWVNGPCAVPGLKSLDGLFKRLIAGHRS